MVNRLVRSLTRSADTVDGSSSKRFSGPNVTGVRRLRSVLLGAWHETVTPLGVMDDGGVDVGPVGATAVVIEVVGGEVVVVGGRVVVVVAGGIAG